MTGASAPNRMNKNRRPTKSKTTTAEQQSITIGNMRRKTEMCRYMQQNKFCPFGEKCQYAHSEEQKVVLEEDWKHIYRTKPCAYLSRGEKCPYGTKCAFSHSHAAGEQQANFTQGAPVELNNRFDHHNQSGPFSIGMNSLNRCTSKREPSPELEALILECSKTQSPTPASPKVPEEPELFLPSMSSKLWSNTEINQVLNFNWCSRISSHNTNFAINPIALFAKLSPTITSN